MTHSVFATSVLNDPHICLLPNVLEERKTEMIALLAFNYLSSTQYIS